MGLVCVCGLGELIIRVNAEPNQLTHTQSL